MLIVAYYRIIYFFNQNSKIKGNSETSLAIDIWRGTAQGKLYHGSQNTNKRRHAEESK